jgi:hypothetical protein
MVKMLAQVQALQTEISRIRGLKRELEGNVEMLRSEMESGKIRLRVNKDSNFRQKLAEAIVTEAHPDYIGEYQGFYYADPVDGVVYLQKEYDPWVQSLDWRIFSVDKLVSNCDFDPSVDWATIVCDLPDYQEMVKLFLAEEFAEAEAYDSIPSWVDAQEVIAFASNHSEEWAAQIAQTEAEATAEAVSFALSEILDEIEFSVCDF